uniref:NADH dehydrogenase subunit 5 n=1 Tax=Verrallia virginica TaxID=115334 RepID=UPI0026E36043|nr:NADH dehydrogenase subunit 5 [Verrallia virginica]WJW73899.1 NADH dehydrogenase subunit 5 [Verrallia virginica]
MCTIFFMVLLMLSFILFLVSLYYLLMDIIIFIEWEVLSFNSTSIVMTMLFDWMSLIFMSFVMLISSMVVLYSKEYMMEDKNINRFIFLVIMFVMSMMLLIISPNLISILLGWDGLGLVSYCLVIYFNNVKSFNSGMLTVLSNRIGDVAILLAISWMLNYGSWNYLFFLEAYKMDSEMMIIGFLVMLAAMTKSAQIPFSSWLPAAMAAPTPVSALVHSSTLVTAGVYLLIRFNIIFVDTFLGQFLLLVSGLTMFMSGLGANFEFDLKKIIALSTLSQLGLMMSILSMGFLKLAFFHLLSHALFKALLFMCAGSIIHNMNNNQDIRYMGGLSIHMPMTIGCLNVANLALCGMPFLAGFYSKDLILEMVCFSYINLLSFFLYFVSTGLTVCYSFRLVFYSLTGEFNSTNLNMLSDEGWIMLKGMMSLLVMSIIGGSLLNWLIFPTPIVLILPMYLKIMPLLVCILGGLLGYTMFNFHIYYKKDFFNYFMVYFVGYMWFMPYISTYGIIKFPLYFGTNYVKLFDQGWSEYLGSQNLFNCLMNSSSELNLLQNNNLKVHLLLFVFWLIIIMLVL